jgi:hypothetical protein
MSHAAERIDVGVVIDRVRVLVRLAESDAFEPAPPHRPDPDRAGDHRIVVGELRIETDAALDERDARRLGDRIARALGEHLSSLQARRLEAILARRSRGGAVRIGALRVRLQGAEAERPNPGAVAAALVNEVERRVAP